jgi:prepilin-type processing-associated H-X9-DG protein
MPQIGSDASSFPENLPESPIRPIKIALRPRLETTMKHPQWFDVPGTYHNGGCGFAFADGHSESHKWFSPAPKKGHRAPVANPQDFKDWNWMRDRTSAHISGAMPPVQ